MSHRLWLFTPSEQRPNRWVQGEILRDRLRCLGQLGATFLCLAIPLGQTAEASQSHRLNGGSAGDLTGRLTGSLNESLTGELNGGTEPSTGLSVQQLWEVETGDARDRCSDELCPGITLELNQQWADPILLAAPENLDPDLKIRGLPFFFYDASLLNPRALPSSLEQSPNPLIPPPAPEQPTVTPDPVTVPASNDAVAEDSASDPPESLNVSPGPETDAQPFRLKEPRKPRKPFFVLENIQIDLDDDFSNSGQGSDIFEPVFQGRLRDGTPVQFSTGFNVYDEPQFDKLINIPLRFGYEEEIEGIPVDIVGGIDFFNRLAPAPSLSTNATIPLGQKAVLSWALDYGPYKFNVETLENQISHFRYGPSLFWQINEQTTLFSNVTWGRYSDGNREQQSFSRLERRFGEEFALAANLFNWRYQQDIGAASGYFTPGDFLVYSFEGAWEKPIFDFLNCRLAANLGRQHAGGSWSRAYGYDAVCTVSFKRGLEADIGYSFSNTIDRDTGESASNSREISSQVRMKF